MDNQSAVPTSPEPPQPRPSPPPVAGTPKKSNLSMLVTIAVAIVIALVAGIGGYLYGKSRAPAKTATAATQADKELTVPEGATVIGQCVDGRGTQYILPKDIPEGPIYNVYQGKVIGLEYMVPKAELAAIGTNMKMLDLFNQKYMHMMIGDVPHGHAGNPEDHYHFDFMMVPESVSDAIKCDGSSTTTHDHMSM